MSQGTKLSCSEFIRDLRLVVTSPAHRFPVIRERGASWGSMALLLAPTYLAFSFVGGIYFRRDPFAGYSFIPPLIIALLAIYLKLLLIHVSARLMQGSRQGAEKPGSFRDLKVVFGYTGVPGIMAILLATAVFLSLPREVGYLMRDLKAVGVSIMVALAIALFIWNLILVVLALRSVYGMRDIKSVVAFIFGSAMMLVPGLLSYWVVAQPHVDFVYAEPVLHPRILRIFAADPTSTISSSTKISIHVDRMAFSLREPERFEIVAYAIPKKADGTKARAVIGSQPAISWEDRDYALGRIIGLPGDTVELDQGNLRVNGQAWKEPYVIPEYQAPVTIHQRLAAREFLILPDNRHLVATQEHGIFITRDRILGREILSRWPIGWWIYRPTVFMDPIPIQ
jgi:hypothetical protein